MRVCDLANVMPEKSIKTNKVLLWIGGFKLVKVALLIAVGIGVLKLMGKDLADELQKFIEQFNLDPDNKYFQKALHQVAGVGPGKMVLVSAAHFFMRRFFWRKASGWSYENAGANI